MSPRSSSSSGSTPGDEHESSLPLGQRLVKAGLISQSQLAQALREQQQNHLKLGEICLERGWLQVADLYRFLPSHSLSLGEILVALGYLNFEQLRVALAQQRRYGRKLGEILTWKGWVQQATLDHALDVQVQLQRLAAPNAWEALQPFLAAPKTAAVPQPGDPLQVIQTQGETPTSYKASSLERKLETAAEPPLELMAPLLDFQDPGSSLEPQMTLADYRKQVEALKLQLQLQEQEWDRILANMNRQVADFQSQYQQRIQELEATIRLQQAELQQRANLQQDLMLWREQLQRLEADLVNARAAEQRAQQQLQTQRDCHQSELEQLQEQIQILQKGQLDSLGAVADLEAQLASTRQQMQQLELERDQLKLQLLQGIPQVATPDSEYSAEGQISELAHLQAQVTRLQEQLANSEAELRSWQERYAQLQQEYSMQVTELSRRPSLEQVEVLQAQLQQLQTEMTSLLTTNREYKAQIAQQEEQLRQSQAQIAQMTAERAEMDQRLAELEGSLQAGQEALEQAQQQLKSMGARLIAIQEQRAKLMVELQQARELLAAYRESLESLQENLRIQQDQNRLLRASYEQQKLIAEAARAELEAIRGPAGSGEEQRPGLSPLLSRLSQLGGVEDEEEEKDWLPEPEENVDPLLADLTPWARNLFQNLQEAGLLHRPQIEQILTTWQQSGGKLTTAIGECAGLKETTIKFFADGGYSARLAGCRRLEEFLRAADLLDPTVWESLPCMDESNHWGDPLIERGLLRPETVEYFRRHFLPPPLNR